MARKESRWAEVLKEAPTTWRRVSIGEVLEERRERDCGDLDLLSVTMDRGVIPRDDLDRRDTSSSDKSRYLRAAPGDLVYNTMRMWQGVSGIASQEGIVSPAYTVARPTDEVDSAYLGYVCRLPNLVDRFRAFSQGIVSDTLNLRFKHFAEIQIPLPPLSEQQKIAAILSSVDDAIAATRKVIEETKRVKKGLLQDLMTRGIGHTRFKKTEIGKIPEEWEVVRLVEIMEDGVQNGYSPRCPNDPTGRWILSLGALSPDGFQPSEKKPAPEHDNKVSEYFLRPGDFLVSRSNTSERVGWSALFRGEIVACAYPDLMMRFRIQQDRVLPEFMEMYLYSRPALKHLQARAAGTSGSMVKINQSVLKTLPVAVPPIDEQQKIADLLERFRSVQESQKETALKRLKRGLMQDLLTGRVRVPVD